MDDEPVMLVGAVAWAITVTVTTDEVAAEHGEFVTIAR
jgi:hypothetical protein